MSAEDIDRAAEAHRTAFALLAEALHNPATFDPDQLLGNVLNESENPSRLTLDVIHSLVWHAAGAFQAVTGSNAGAIELVQKGSLMQEKENQARHDREATS
jgi:hypothetical protein